MSQAGRDFHGMSEKIASLGSGVGEDGDRIVAAGRRRSEDSFGDIARTFTAHDGYTVHVTSDGHLVRKHAAGGIGIRGGAIDMSHPA